MSRCVGGVRYASIPGKAFCFFFFSCVFDRRRTADKRSRSRSFSKTHSQLNMWEVVLQRKRSRMKTKTNASWICPSLPSSHAHSHRYSFLPTSLHRDAGRLFRQFANEGSVAWKFFYEVGQDHSIVTRLQLFYIAFIFEPLFRRCSRRIGVNDWYLVQRFPRELIGFNFLGLGRAVHSQGFIRFKAHWDCITLCWD